MTVALSPSSTGPLLVTPLMMGEMLGGWPTLTRPPSTPAVKSKKLSPGSTSVSRKTTWPLESEPKRLERKVALVEWNQPVSRVLLPKPVPLERTVRPSPDVRWVATELKLPMLKPFRVSVFWL